MSKYTGNFGALPAILVTVIGTMVKNRFSQAQIQSQLAANYEEMKRLSEADITELALVLGRETDIPEWEWFNTLRSARDMALFSNGGNGDPPPPPPPAETNITPWVIAGLAALVVLITLTK